MKLIAGLQEEKYAAAAGNGNGYAATAAGNGNGCAATAGNAATTENGNGSGNGLKTKATKVEEPIEISAALGGARAVLLPPREEQQEQEFAEVSGVTITEIIAGADVKAKGIRMSGEIGMFVDTGRPPGRLLGG